MKIKTKLVKSGSYTTKPRGVEYRTVNPPIYKGSTIILKYDDWKKLSHPPFHGNFYGTYGNPAQLSFQDAICELENGHVTRACPSGLSAIVNTLFALTQMNDHVLVCDDVYGPTKDFCLNALSKYGVETTFLPGNIGKDVTEYIKPNTKLIFLESPGSNTFEIQDIEEVVKIAKEKNIITVMDNTWATPLFFKPLDHGIDVSICAATKYIGGHSDILLGAITVNEKYAQRMLEFYELIECFVSSEVCYLGVRGIKTLELRLKQHEESALEIATWLEGVDLVEKVMHPALSSHPQHHLFKKYFKGSSGVFGFILKEEYAEENLESFFNSLKVFSIGLSWGGVDSLIKAEKYSARQYLEDKYKNKLMFRLSVGLEDIADLKDDLEEAFEKFREA